jgi:Ca2+-binding EF-hand superfamily protein
VVLDMFLKADTNHDGVIEYDEFIPAMKAIIAGAKDAKNAAPAPAAAPAMPNLEDVPEEMLERYLQKLFQIADTNGDGVLQPDEFANLLQKSGFNFPPSMVARLVDAADINYDGVIEYDEFVPAMISILRDDEVVDNQMPALADVPPAMLENYLGKLFAVGDTNGDGVLQPSELARLLELSGFNFSPAEVKAVVSAADTNRDGVIDYEEFVPLAIEILNSRQEDGAPAMPNLDDVPEPMLERYLRKLFAIADENGDGVLQPEEFEKLLKLSGFNFAPSVVRQLMQEADVNRDGVIQYDEFLPVAMNIIRSRKQSDMKGMPRIEDVPAPMLERYFRKLFAIADQNGDGVLQPKEFERLLSLSGFSFTNDQVRALAAQADTNRDGLIQYDEFIPVAMEILAKQQDQLDTHMDDQSAESAKRFLLQNKTQAQLERQMKKLFLFADEDCSGFLDANEFKNILSQCGLPLTAQQSTQLMARCDVNRDGKISYEEFVPVAFDLMVEIVAGNIKPQPTQQPRRAAPRAAPAPAKKEGWTATRSQYQAPAVPEPIRVQPGGGDVASLEGRVLAVQSRRIIRSKIKDLFAKLDGDNDGRLTAEEVARGLGAATASRILSSTDGSNGGKVTQYEMRRFFDDECGKAVESGVPEYKYLEGIVGMLESAI